MNFRALGRRTALGLSLVLGAALAACVPLGLTLPFEKDDLPSPDGGRLKTSLGWMTNRIHDEIATAPDGSVALEPKRVSGHSVWQQVRHFNTDKGEIGDSVLLDRETLRPIATWRWTPEGTYVTKYNHREVERTFKPLHGSQVRRVETEDVEPYSALGMELVVSSLPLRQGYVAMVPVTVDTVIRGWSWLKIEVMTEMSLVERSDAMDKDSWVVDCSVDGDRTRLWIQVDGRSVRKIEKLGPDNEVLGVMRRMLLGLPTPHRGP